MVNFGPLAAEIGPAVWGTPANFNGCCILAVYCTALQYRASAKLRCSTEGATYIRHDGNHVGHWPTF